MAANYNSYNSSSSNTVTLAKPDDTAEGGLLVFLLLKRTYTESPTSTPGSISPDAERTDINTDLAYNAIFHKVCGASEPASYAFTWADASKAAGVVVYIPPGDFDPDDPIDVISNTKYVTSGTAVRAASATISSDTSVYLWFGMVYNATVSPTLTLPGGFSAIGSRFGDSNSDLWSWVGQDVLDSGATGNLDGTLGTSSVVKHAFGIVLNPEPPVVPVDALTIAGVTVPVAGETPDTTVTADAQWTGSTTWYIYGSETVQTDPFEVGGRYYAIVNLTAAAGYTFEGVSENSFTITGADSTFNAANSGEVTGVYPQLVSTVTTLAVAGVTVPVAGAAPDDEVLSVTQYSGSITWDPSTNPHQPSTAYTATITLTAKTGYTFIGVAANSFTVAGASSVSNSADSGVITAEFPATAATVTDLSISGVTAPVAGETPVSTITSEAQFTGSVSWSPTPTGGKFQPGVAYTANITRTPASGYTFYGFAANSATVAGATVTNSANSGNAAALFSATASTITTTAIAGIAVPVAGDSQDTAGTETSEYTVAVTSYDPDDDPLDYDTIYTVVLEVSPKSGWTLYGLAGDSFTVSGATSVTHDANDGTVTVVFPATDIFREPVDIAAIEGVTPPVAGGTPVTVITATAQYTGVVTWIPNNPTFNYSTEYQAVITLTAEAGYTFVGVSADFFSVAGASSVTNDADSGVVTATFPITSTGKFSRPGMFFSGL